MSNWHDLPNVRDNIKWTQDMGRWKLNFFLSIIMIGMVLNGYDGTVISNLQSFDSWNEDLGYPTSVRLGLLNACAFFSGIAAGPMIQFIDDTFGRKWGIRFYSYTLLAGSILGCVAGVSGANGYALFICGRILIGFGLTSFLMTSLTIVQEITHPRTRALVAASWDSYWILGSVACNWVCFGCSYIQSSWQWRLPYLIQVVPAIWLLIAIQFVPETPRFLIGRGREEEAFKFLVDYHANGDSNDPLVLYEFDEMKNTIRQERAAKAEKWSNILRSRPNQHRIGLAMLMQFCLCLSGASIIYYYYSKVFDLVGITDATVQTGINAGMSVFTWICQLVAVYVGQYVGRKTMLLWLWPCLLLGLIGQCVASGVFKHASEGNTSAGIACVAMVWIYQGFYNATNPIVYSYPSEVLTFSMRSKGLLVWNTCNQFFNAYATFVDPIALDSIGYKYYIVYMPAVIIQWILIKFFMRETKGFTLEQIDQVFSGASTDSLIPVSDNEVNSSKIRENDDTVKSREAEEGATVAYN